MSSPRFTTEQIRAVLTRAGAHALSIKAQERLTWLLHYSQCRSVSETCRCFGITRVTLYRLMDRFDPLRPETLEDQSRRPHTIHTSVSPEAVRFIREYRQQSPQMSKEAIADLLLREHGIRVSASAVGRTIAREGLFFGDSPLHMRKRMSRDAQSVLPVAPVPVQHADHHCFFCNVRKKHWPHVRRTVVIASVLSNIAFIGFVLLNAYLEVQRADLPPTDPNIHVSASLIPLE